ncbi:hypothetical protein Sru01_62060 [Sphaerisporangium rufum]|uniref:Type II secretion system protein GspF domain-containing protein n=1 Tax=Sphaerisporangium rufum TaxID=1381558 RepID=A0A919V2Z9_9ACTN|nr:type II secretion system F family protein [Sphaerisporangium rufum]GII81224.1 hypothetical protein Sru01_62060 [Sphaerisporangium rufum]
MTTGLLAPLLAAVTLAGLAAWVWWAPGDAAARLARLCGPGAGWVAARPGPPGSLGAPGRAGDRGGAATGAGSNSAPGRVTGPKRWSGPTGGAGPPPASRWARLPGLVFPLLPAMVAGALFVGGPPGVLAGLAGGVAVSLARRRRVPGEVRRRQARIATDLPFAIDLMVACLRAGQPVDGALAATAAAMTEPLAGCLGRVNARLRLGAGPETAWSVLDADRPLAPLARGMTRAALTGAPVADVLARLAADARLAARAESAAAARRVGVQVVAPLGLCFLPAFVLLGVVPIIAALAGQAF